MFELSCKSCKNSEQEQKHKTWKDKNIVTCLHEDKDKCFKLVPVIKDKTLKEAKNKEGQHFTINF